MAIRFPDPMHPVDPVELEINQIFDHLVMCLQQRRVALLTTYRDTRDQIAAKLIARTRKKEELIGLKTETEARLQMNELRETQEQLLAVIEQKLAELGIPQPETSAVFRFNCGHLEQVIAGVGEVIEEVSVVRYEENRPNPVFKIPVPKQRSRGPKSTPTSYRRCNLCYQVVPPRGHKCVPLPPGERQGNLCGVCFLEMDPTTLETHQIECLKSQQSEYTELHSENWQRCLSCLIYIPPEYFKQHISTCDDMLLGAISRYKKFTPNLAEIDWTTAALTKEQKEALDHVVKSARVMSNGAAKVLSERVARLNFTPKDLEATLEWISFEAPIIIHVFLDKLLPILITDTHYRNQFETGTSHGSRDLGARARWEDNIFKNIYRGVKAEDRVKYGVLNIVGDINGVKSCKQYGDSYFILKRVRLRTSLADTDSSSSAVKIASCEHYKHLLNKYTDSELKAIIKVATKKEPFLSSDVIQPYHEVQIHGPIELAEHLECVVANPRHKSDSNTKELLETFITKNKCNLIWMS